MFKNILVPTDGSEFAEKALTAAVEVAKANGGKIVGISVAEPYPYSPLSESAFFPGAEQYDREAQEMAQVRVQRMAAVAVQSHVPFEAVSILSVDPAGEIVRAAEARGCDTIFMASHGRKGMSRILLGSVTQKVLVQSQIPVLVIR